MTETCEGCDSQNTRLAVRARESKEEFGALQIVECRDCGRRWSE